MGRTLLIDSRPTGDWSLDLLFAGLVRSHGSAGIIDYPAFEKHRRGIPIMTGDPEKDWGAERGSLCYVKEPPRIWSRQEILDELVNNRIDRIFIDERPESYELYLELKANFFKVPVVVVAGHDRFWNVGPHIMSAYYGKNLEAMFIDNWRPEYDGLPRTYVYNWSINFNHFWDPNKRQSLLADKKYDISFIGYNSGGHRARFVDHILSKWGHLNNHIVLERRPNTMELFRPKREYFTIMAQSKVCLNLRGDAENGKTLRFYEIPYVGSCMLTQDTAAKQIHPFTHGTHCCYFSDEKELDSLLENLLDDDNFREKIARQGHEHAMRYHTVDARVAQIYGAING